LRQRRLELEGAERRAKCLELALRGFTSRQIGEVLHLSHTAVNNHLKRARAALAQQTLASAQELVASADARLDYGLQKLDPVLTQTRNLPAIPAAVNALVAIERRRAQMHGYDAAQRLEHTGADGGPIPVAVAPELTLADYLVQQGGVWPPAPPQAQLPAPKARADA